MRPAGRAETESLYFDYPYFEAPHGTARATLSNPAKVAIAGAGPVGMTAALALAKEGIPSVLLDNKSTLNDGSRAICVARESFYILQRLGALAPFKEKALGWTTGRSFYRGKQVLEFRMQDSEVEKYRPMYNLEQQYIEQYLWDAVAGEPLIDARWQSEVVAVEDKNDGIELTIRDPQETYRLPAEWLLAADGARSTIRAQRGLRLKGDNYEGRYVIADIQMAFDHPTIRLALFDPDCRRGGTVLVHRQPDNIWRIDYQLTDDEDPDDATREENVSQSVAAVLKDIGYSGPWELEWWSIYTANTLALDDYRDGRIFFIGDSAHIVPIFGVRGLNNGLADAQNIAWKLGWVIKGKAGDALLDSYTPERRGATLDVFENASKAARFMTPQTRGWQIMRDAALSLALDYEFAGNLANPRNMTPYTYADSPIVSADDDAFSGGPVPGAVLPETVLENGHLSDQLGPWFNLICFDPKIAEQVAHLMDVVDEELNFILLPPSSPAAKLLEAAEASAYLIRPDRHIAGRWKKATADAIVGTYHHCLGLRD